MTLLIPTVTKRELLLTVLIQFWAEGCREERNTSIIVWFNTKFLRAKIILNVQHTVSKIDIWIKGVQEFIDKILFIAFCQVCIHPLGGTGGRHCAIEVTSPKHIANDLHYGFKVHLSFWSPQPKSDDLVSKPQLHIFLY